MASFKGQQPFFKHNFGEQTNLDIHRIIRNKLGMLLSYSHLKLVFKQKFVNSSLRQLIQCPWTWYKMTFRFIQPVHPMRLLFDLFQLVPATCMGGPRQACTIFIDLFKVHQGLFNVFEKMNCQMLFILESVISMQARKIIWHIYFKRRRLSGFSCRMNFNMLKTSHLGIIDLVICCIANGWEI